MMVYGYNKTSRQRIEEASGSNPEALAMQLRQEGVPEADIYRDVGTSEGAGTTIRAARRR